MITEKYDIIIIGGGHAGCEAALASARMGHKTLLTAVSLDSIALMPCNPNIGGTSKGHLVREIDALGGEMGKNIDKSYIQSRMLNMSKGPAVYSLRAQADKRKYSAEMKKVLENTDHLTIRQTEIMGLLFDGGRISGVTTESGLSYSCKAVVICAGTYVKSRCLYGETIINSGPNGLRNAGAMGDCLRGLGVTMLRFKTGTPARIDARSINYERMQIQEGDREIVPFSFTNTRADIEKSQSPCYLTYTNEETHRIIRQNLHRSPMYAGVIEGTGTRYCPSIEDKVVRFAEVPRHQVFIEPEGEDTNEMYVSGMSTSMPEDVQLQMYRTVPGLENCSFTRAGYAIEYDCIDATQLTPSLAFKKIPGLFSAGQFNGSSGYEEAAAQGIVAGINAALYVAGRDMIRIGREQGYIGVLIDDLVTKGSREPYRMMTSRAEYRLTLRQDNADLRLTEMGYSVGLVSEERYRELLAKKTSIEIETERLRGVVVAPGQEINSFLVEHGSSEIVSGVRLYELIKRPELNYDMLAGFDRDRPSLSASVGEQVNISIKYEGYIKRQQMQIQAFKRLEDKLLPSDIDYDHIKGLRIEARQKLGEMRPFSVGQAARIAGVSPADIAMLMVYIK